MTLILYGLLTYYCTDKMSGPQCSLEMLSHKVVGAAELGTTPNSHRHEGIGNGEEGIELL